jgi:hypothetical protein
MATLLVDLLTAREELDGAAVFDVEMPAQRLAAVEDWARHHLGGHGPAHQLLRASAGAAEALGGRPRQHRGGRGARCAPDLVAPQLGEGTGPMLFIVGGAASCSSSRRAHARMRYETPDVLPGPPTCSRSGAPERAAELARN